MVSIYVNCQALQSLENRKSIKLPRVRLKELVLEEENVDLARFVLQTYL